MIDVQERDSGCVVILTMNGRLTCKHSDALKGVFMRYIDSAGHIILDFEQVSEVDPACLELICSACQHSKRLNKCLTFTGISTNTFKQALEDSCYSPYYGCVLNRKKSCLWMEWAIMGDAGMMQCDMVASRRFS